MKYTFIFSILLLFSCSSKDQKMCDCLASGDKLNKFSSSLLQKEITEKDAKELKKLKAEQTKKCVDFQTMSGEEMLKRKEGCAN